MFFKPAQFKAESTFFVPLTLLEKQIDQNGMGFGSPVEVDAQHECIIGIFGRAMWVLSWFGSDGSCPHFFSGWSPRMMTQ